MSKVIMMKGLPASGKSTKAKEIVDQGNWVRVNRDLLREMLHFNKWSGKNEGITVDAEKELVKFFISKNINVVIDDTNMNPKNMEMWKSIAIEAGASNFATLEKGTTVEECLRREKFRQKVGEHVVMKMALQFEKYPKPEKPFVICDVDGTVADCNHRKSFLEGERKNWKGFFDEMHKDTPIESTIAILEEYKAKGHEIIFVSARPENYRKQTEDWIRNNIVSIVPLTLIMREQHDSRQDTEVKQDIFDKYFKDKYEIETVIDDRPSVIRMWRENGLEVIDVGDGVEF